MCVFQCCAAAFIEKLDAQSLNLSLEEFERYMSGQASPRCLDSHLTPRAPPPLTSSPALTDLHRNLELLSDVGRRQDTLTAAAQELRDELLSWTRGVERQVQDVLDRFPLNLRSHGGTDRDQLPPPRSAPRSLPLSPAPSINKSTVVM